MIYEENYEDISHSLKLSGVDVISHELAHQFFGDSVTCEWWNYTWLDSIRLLLREISNFLYNRNRLNEGFATLFEFHITGILYPDWRTRDFFNLRKLHNAFRSDSRDATRSMTFEVVTLSDISASFDTIGYDKCKNLLKYSSAFWN